MTDLAAIRRLARSGAAQRAWDAFCAAGHDQRKDDPGLLTLKGRLLKDLAIRASNGDRTLLLRRAAEAYSAASAFSDDSYPRINAATLVYLRGDRATAAAMASDLLSLLDEGRHGAETPYWLAATRAEALLLMGRISDAQSALSAGIALAPRAREDRAATLRQFRRILAASDADDSWLAQFALPPVMHFRGPMAIVSGAAETAISQAVQDIAPALAFGALAAGTDIVAAEAALELGAEIHVVLPSDIDSFRNGSVVPLGSSWDARFDRLIDAAHSLETLDEAGGLTMAAVRLADDMAMGLAVCEAIANDSHPVMLRARWAGGADAPLLGAPHRLVTVDLDARSDASAQVLAGPSAPVFALVSQEDATLRIVPVDEAQSLASYWQPGDVIDAYVPDSADDVDSPRLAGLAMVAAGDRVLLSRPAAMIAIAQCAGFRPVLAGSANGPAGAMDVFEIAPE
jgi:hypothetical protein